MNIKRNKIDLQLVIVLGLILRLVSINQSLWLDEGIQAWAVYNHNLVQLFKDYMPGDFNPPLTHILTWISVRLLGFNELGLRFPSLIAGVTLIWIVWRLTGNLLGKLENIEVFKLFSALLIATSPLLIYYSQEARMYILATLFVTWSMTVFYEILVFDKKLYLEYFIVTGLMIFSHYMAWFILPVQVILLLIYSKFDFQKCFKFFSSLFVWVILSLFFLIPQLRVGDGAVNDLEVWKSLSSFSFRQLIMIPAKFLVGRIPIEFNIFYILIVLVPILIIIYLFIKSYKYIIKDKFNFIYLLSWLIIPIIIGIIISFKLAIFSYFRFLFILPSFYLLIVLLSGYFNKNKKLINFLLYFFIIYNLIFSFIYLLNTNYHRENWKKVSKYLDSDSSPVLIISAVDRPLWFYDQNKHYMFDILDINKVSNLNSFWYIDYGQPIFYPEANFDKEFFKFKLLSEKIFVGDITVKFYKNNNKL